MAGTPQKAQAGGRCVLCPAGCELGLVPTGPDAWRVEYPETANVGLCPRGSAVGELLGHPRRILTSSQRDGGQARAVDLQSALREILAAAAGKKITLLLDGNVPWEQMAAAAAWAAAWPRAQLCLVVEPGDRPLLLGIEASGADYLADAELADCDGFLIIGDAFSANPRCSRGVLDRHKAEPKTPIVVIDPGAGSPTKFATHRVDVAPGMELPALSAVAAAARVEGVTGAAALEEMPSAVAAGNALTACKRLGVLIAAEYGRTASWSQIGHLAGRLAKALGGGVAPQTAGANVLAAVRLEAEGTTISLAKALSAEQDVKVAIGCDVLGLLGMQNVSIFGAASALPNATTAAAQVVLPVAMPGEYGGTYLFDGKGPVKVAALLAPPVGVQTPGDLVAALARAAGIANPIAAPRLAPPGRVSVAPPGAAPARPEPSTPVLLLGRQAAHFGCGGLTAHASWQAAGQPLPELRMPPQDAGEMNLNNLSVVNVASNGASVSARLRVAPELAPGTMVLPEGFARTRALLPARVELEHDAVVAEPGSAEVSG